MNKIEFIFIILLISQLKADLSNEIDSVNQPTDKEDNFEFC